MPARTVLKVDNVDKRGEIVFRRIEVEKRKGGKKGKERATICEAPSVKRMQAYDGRVFHQSFENLLEMFQGHLVIFSFFLLSFVYLEKIVKK